MRNGFGGTRVLSWQLGLLFACTLVLDLVLVAATTGSSPDIQAFLFVDAALRDDPLHVYAVANPGDGFAWPYPPGYFPALLFIGEIAQQIGFGFDKLIRLPQIGASLGIAWLVQWHLGYRGASPRARLIAAAMIVLHPAVITLSSMHGQIDPVQWLPAVAAVIAWERLPENRRAVAAGLLIGIAASVKPPPALVLLALLPLAAGWRERGLLTACAAGVPLLLTAPFLIADLSGTLSLLDYNGIPGHGGISLLVQPDLALLRFAGKPVDELTGISELVQDIAPIAVLLVTAAITVRLFQVRPDPAAGVAMLIVGVFVAGANYLPPYAIWLVPFLVLAGWTRFYWVITALMLVPLAFRYVPGRLINASPFGEGLLWHEWAVLYLYLPTGAALWAAYTFWLASRLRAPRAVESPRLEPAGTR